MMVTINGVDRYYDDTHVDNLQMLQRIVNLNWDGLIYYGGYEGDGKSVKAAQDAIYLDPTWTIDRMCWTPQQFLRLIDKAQKGQAIVFDESQDVFDSGATKDKMSRIVKSVLTRCRSKNLFILIIAPDYWRINKYLFIQRSRAFIRVYADGLERGSFAFYNRERKHELYIKGRKEENHNVVKPNYRGSFTNWVPFDWVEYEKRKQAALKEISEESDGIEMTPALKRKIVGEQIKVVEFFRRNQWFKKDGVIKSFCSFVGISEPTYRNYREESKIIGQNEPDMTDVVVFEPKKKQKILINSLGENNG